MDKQPTLFVSKWRQMQQPIIAAAKAEAKKKQIADFLQVIQEADATDGRWTVGDISINWTNAKSLISESVAHSLAVLKILVYMLPNNRPDLRKQGFNPLNTIPLLIHKFQVWWIWNNSSQSRLYEFLVSFQPHLGHYTASCSRPRLWSNGSRADIDL